MKKLIGHINVLTGEFTPVKEQEVKSNTSEFLLPCPICNGIEGCDHTVLERARDESERREK